MVERLEGELRRLLSLEARPIIIAALKIPLADSRVLLAMLIHLEYSVSSSIIEVDKGSPSLQIYVAGTRLEERGA